MKRSTRFVLLGVILVALASLMAASYAYFTYSVDGDSPTGAKGSAKSGTPNIEIEDNMDGINLGNTYPMPDGVGLTTEPYIYTITNKESEKTINVSVMLEVYADSTLSDSLVNIGVDSVVKSLSSLTTTEPSKDKFKSSYIVDTFTLNPGETKSTELRSWINEDGTVDNAQNKTWSSKLLFTPVYR